MRIYDPRQSKLYDVERHTEDTFAFVASIPGQYKLCFLNLMSTVTGKMVSFQMHVGNSLQSAQMAKKEHLDPLGESVAALMNSVNSVRDDISYLQARESVHRDSTCCHCTFFIDIL